MINFAVEDFDLVKAFQVIKNYGFLTAKTPLIISCENHIETFEGLAYFVKYANEILNEGNTKIISYEDLKTLNLEISNLTTSDH